MGRMSEADYARTLGRERGLDVHLDTNFYPPLFPDYKERVKAAFKEYWLGDLDLEGLAEACHFRDTEDVIRYFTCFLAPEDVGYDEY